MLQTYMTPIMMAPVTSMASTTNTPAAINTAPKGVIPDGAVGPCGMREDKYTQRVYQSLHGNYVH